MNINWRLKSSVFKLIDIFSLHRALYFAQKHITKRARLNFSEIDENWITHRTNLKPIQSPHILEFGAGQSLAQNIYLSEHFRSQVVVDLFRMLDIKLFNDAALQISKLQPSLKYVQVQNTEEIHNKYNIRYVAPLDLRNSPFKDNEFDGCISTNTLEHIRKKDIVKIFTELKRIVRHNGLVSAVIDYSDHYSHTDTRIGPLNFLKYSSKEFNKHNHRVHYQNRLRHNDYLSIFSDLGYVLVKQEATDFAEPPQAISEEFNKNDPTLCALYGIFLLKNLK